MLGPRPEPPHAVSLPSCLGYVMVLEPGTGDSNPDKAPWGSTPDFHGSVPSHSTSTSQAITSDLGRTHFVQDAIEDIL